MIIKKDKENLKIKRYFKNVSNNKNLKMPSSKTKYSAGYDIHSPYDFVLEPNETKIVDTGIKYFTSNGYDYLMIVPRSGLGCKYGLQLRNTIGIIDADYSDTIKLTLVNTGEKSIDIKFNDAIAQIIIQQYKKLNPDYRMYTKRKGGFGSTGK